MPYLRLKKTRKPLFLQLETTKALKKLKIEKKFSEIFLEVSGKSHSAKNCERGDPLGFFDHPFCCKMSKIDENKKNAEKNEKFEQSHSAEKRGKSHSVEKSGPHALKMKY